MIESVTSIRYYVLESLEVHDIAEGCKREYTRLDFMGEDSKYLTIIYSVGWMDMS